MRILIPGISSQVGRLLTKRLVAEGHEVTGIDRRPWPDAPAGVEVFETDLRKRPAEEVFRKLRPECVVHLATVTHLLHRSEDRYRINLGGTRALFDNAVAHGVEHVIFVGRHTYYGAAPDAPMYHTEDEPPMALSSFPELADLVAADLYAGSALWRQPKLVTSVLRVCYTLGPSGSGTLGTFLKGKTIPTILGYDPLFQFMHEADLTEALVATILKRPRGVFNVAGPQPLPLSVVIHESGRRVMPLPEFLFAGALGRFGLPKLPAGALSHIKFPLVVDAAAFRAATGFAHTWGELETLHAYRDERPATAV
jgi:UDP-glucose 4-epimerase